MYCYVTCLKPVSTEHARGVREGAAGDRSMVIEVGGVGDLPWTWRQALVSAHQCYTTPFKQTNLPCFNPSLSSNYYIEQRALEIYISLKTPTEQK